MTKNTSPSVSEILHDFAVNLHEYANGRANGLVYGREIAEATQAIHALVLKTVMEALPEKEDAIHSKTMPFDGAIGYNVAIDQLRTNLQEALGRVFHD